MQFLIHLNRTMLKIVYAYTWTYALATTNLGSLTCLTCIGKNIVERKTYFVAFVKNIFQGSKMNFMRHFLYFFAQPIKIIAFHKTLSTNIECLHIHPKFLFRILCILKYIENIFFIIGPSSPMSQKHY